MRPIKRSSPLQRATQGGTQCLLNSLAVNSWPAPPPAPRRRPSNSRCRRSRKPRRSSLACSPSRPVRWRKAASRWSRACSAWLKEHDNMMAGRKVEFFSADTGGKPAGTKTKAQELIERDKVDVIVGPLAAFELLAIGDYISEHKTPMLSLAGADDLTQRRPNPYFLRPSATSSQCMHPMGHYAAKEMGTEEGHHHRLRFRLRLRAGRRLPGGVREGRRLRQRQNLWTPLGTPDYTPYLAQIERLRRRSARALPAAARSLHQAVCAVSASNSRWSPARPAATTRCCTRSATRRSAW